MVHQKKKKKRKKKGPKRATVPQLKPDLQDNKTKEIRIHWANSWLNEIGLLVTSTCSYLNDIIQTIDEREAGSPEYSS